MAPQQMGKGRAKKGLACLLFLRFGVVDDLSLFFYDMQSQEIPAPEPLPKEGKGKEKEGDEVVEDIAKRVSPVLRRPPTPPDQRLKPQVQQEADNDGDDLEAHMTDALAESSGRRVALSMRSEASLSIATDFDSVQDRQPHNQRSSAKYADQIEEEAEEPEEEEREENQEDEEDNTAENQGPSIFERAWEEITYFFGTIVDAKSSMGGDYYVPMFMADIVVFVLTVIFFNNFSSEPNSDLESVGTFASQVIIFFGSANYYFFWLPDFDGKHCASSLCFHRRHRILHDSP